MKLKLCAFFLFIAVCAFSQQPPGYNLTATLVAQASGDKIAGGWLDLPVQAIAGADVYVWITCNVDPAYAPCVLVVMSGLENYQFTPIGQPVYDPQTNKQEQLFVGHIQTNGPTVIRAVTDPFGGSFDFGMLLLEVNSGIYSQ
jgi:hypothetical protein